MADKKNAECFYVFREVIYCFLEYKLSQNFKEMSNTQGGLGYNLQIF